MARNKTLLMKEIKQALEQCQHVLATCGEQPTFQELMVAANSAIQAGTQLHRMAGMVDVENDRSS